MASQLVDAGKAMQALNRQVGRQRLVPALAGALGIAATGLAGCGDVDGGSPPAQVTVTVTATAPAEAIPAEPSATEASAVTSESSSPPPEDGAGLSAVQELEPAEAAQEARVSGDGAVHGLSFRDFNGANTVVLREVIDSTGTELLADHVSYYPQADEFEVLREVRDGVRDCEDGDVTAEFLPGSLAVHDDDEDDVGEVTFTYRLACRTDVSAAEQKLLVLVDGEKYILRGETSTPFQPFEDPMAEPEARMWPEAVYVRAIARYRELAPEFTPISD